jgi:hypothetical protein
VNTIARGYASKSGHHRRRTDRKKNTTTNSDHAACSDGIAATWFEAI